MHRARCFESEDRTEQGLTKLAEAPEEFGRPTFDFVERQDISKHLQSVPTHRDAEKQAVQSEAPGVLAELGLSVLATVIRVDAPPDFCTLDPRRDAVEFVRGDAEAGLDWLERQQIEDLGGGDPAPHHPDDADEGVDQGVLRPYRSIGHAEGDERWVVVVALEHRLDQWRIGLDIGKQDRDVPWLQRRVIGKHRQEVVMQDLDLAHRGVTRMQRHRRIVRRGLVPLRLLALEVKHPRLERGERRVLTGVDVEGLLILFIVDLLEDTLELAADRAEGYEQRGHRIEDLGRHAPTPKLGPVLLRRRHNEQMDGDHLVERL